MPWARIQIEPGKKRSGRGIWGRGGEGRGGRGGEGRGGVEVYKNIFQGRVAESTISTNPDLTFMIKYSFYIKVTQD